MLKKSLGIFLLIISMNALAGKLEKGYEALMMFDYFKAKDYFDKSLDKEPAGAAFGLSKVYSAEKSPFYSMDTAFYYIKIAETAYKNADEKTILTLNELNVTQGAINREKEHIATYFFNEATKINTLDGYQDFLDNHPEAEEFAEAQKLRNHQAYLKAKNENTIPALKGFMRSYPESEDFLAAQKQFYLLEYKSIVQEGNAFTYQVFIKNKPENPYVDEAQEIVYKLYTKTKTPGSYLKFIEENPENKFVEKAWDRLYQLKAHKFTPAVISEFIIDYPAYPNKEKLKEDLALSRELFIPAKKGELWGFVDTTGTWRIKPQYGWVSSFVEGKAVAGLFGKSVYINKRGSLMFNMYDDATDFHNGLAIIEVEEKMGVINFLGDTVVPVKFDEVGNISHELMYAGSEEEGYGYYNIYGKLVIKHMYQSAFDFKDNKAIVGKNGKYGVINVLGQPLLPIEYEWIIPDSNVFVIKKGNLYGLISTVGDTLMPFEYNLISKFYCDRAIAVKGEEYQYVNRKGKPAFNATYPYLPTTLNYSKYVNCHARISENGKVGVIDKMGKKIYPQIFTDMGNYDVNLTPITKGDGWGYANDNVELKIPYSYTYATNFIHGLAVVTQDSVMGAINSDNEAIVPIVYDNVTILDTSFIEVTLNGKKGIVNFNNDTLLNVTYDKIEFQENGIIQLESEGLQELFSISLNKIIYREE